MIIPFLTVELSVSKGIMSSHYVEEGVVYIATFAKSQPKSHQPARSHCINLADYLLDGTQGCEIITKMTIL